LKPLSPLFLNFPLRVFSLSLSLSLSVCVFSSLQKQKVVSFIWDGVARSLAKRWCSLSNAAKRSLFTRERVKIITTKTRAAESRDGKNSKKRNLNKNTKKKKKMFLRKHPLLSLRTRESHSRPRIYVLLLGKSVRVDEQ
jgi:hypothetical protein